MPQAPYPDSKRPNPRDYLLFPRISILIPTVVGIFIAILGTAWTFTLAFKPPQVSKSSASFKTTFQLPIVQPTSSQPLTHIPKQSHKPIALGTPAKRSTLSAEHPVRLITPSPNSKNTPLALYRLLCHSNRRQENTQRQEINQAQIPERRRAEPILDSQLTPNQPKPTSERREIRVTLSDIVILALENNRPIKNAYLERIAQRQEQRVAEDKFTPNLTPTVSISIAQFGSNRVTTDADLGLGATVSVKVPSGGELSFRWATNGQTLSQNVLNLNINDDPFSQNLQLSFNQPLLRGYSVNVNRASIDIARLTEQVNILDLKSTLSNTITEAIIAYRELIRAQERLKIAQLSLKRAQESLANNQVLIEAGRLAPVDIVQNETEVARRQVSLIEAENNLEAARLALLNIVDIEPTTVIVAADPLTAPAISLNPDKLRQLAFENQPDYLKAQLDLERTKLGLLETQNNRLWDLNLNTSYGYASNDTSDLRIGLALSRQFDDFTAERDFQRSLVNQLKAENTLEEQRENLEIQLMDRIRDVNLSFSQVEMAKKVTESSERQLEIAREKQRLGRNITVFELVRLQDDLVQARNVGLNAIINYLNALTRLDQTLGTTLDTWQVTLERQ
ncbi:TolC family protein [Allocoleopsis sp.]|uniref:TolC family protein n=1 Tax=Allocoleopsis sp. TaxID=3088169 RepID=UPI002FD5A71D